MSKVLRSPLFWIALYGLAAYGGYALYKTSRGFYAAAIKKMGFWKGDIKSLRGFDKDFLAAWYLGAKQKSPFFSYRGERYNTQGGTKIR